MSAAKLDPIDRRILAELQGDGRMTNVELASRVGISAPPCLRRVRTLEEAGYITGYHADINARELGFEVAVFAMVRLSTQAESDLATFEARCKAWPLVRECHIPPMPIPVLILTQLPKQALQLLAGLILPLFQHQPLLLLLLPMQYVFQLAAKIQTWIIQPLLVI